MRIVRGKRSYLEVSEPVVVVLLEVLDDLLGGVGGDISEDLEPSHRHVVCHGGLSTVSVSLARWKILTSGD